MYQVIATDHEGNVTLYYPTDVKRHAEQTYKDHATKGWSFVELHQLNFAGAGSVLESKCDG